MTGSVLTTKSRSCEIVLAKANANPAIAAVTPGAVRTVTAVKPTTTAERRLKRAGTKSVVPNRIIADTHQTAID